MSVQSSLLSYSSLSSSFRACIHIRDSARAAIGSASTGGEGRRIRAPPLRILSLPIFTGNAPIPRVRALPPRICLLALSPSPAPNLASGLSLTTSRLPATSFAASLPPSPLKMLPLLLLRAEESLPTLSLPPSLPLSQLGALSGSLASVLAALWGIRDLSQIIRAPPLRTLALPSPGTPSSSPPNMRAPPSRIRDLPHSMRAPPLGALVPPSQFILSSSQPIIRAPPLRIRDLLQSTCASPHRSFAPSSSLTLSKLMISSAQ